MTLTNPLEMIMKEVGSKENFYVVCTPFALHYRTKSEDILLTLEGAFYRLSISPLKGPKTVYMTQNQQHIVNHIKGVVS